MPENCSALFLPLVSQPLITTPSSLHPRTSLNSLSNFLSDSFFDAIFPSTSRRAEMVEEEEEGEADRLTASML